MKKGMYTIRKRKRVGIVGVPLAIIALSTVVRAWRKLLLKIGKFGLAPVRNIIEGLV